MMDFDKINVYHMVHVDRLPSILQRRTLYSDLTLEEMGISVGTSIAYENIRQRRRETPVEGVADLVIGGCVPFYFGTHTPMLLRARTGKTSGYDYEGGQEPIVYLVFRVLDLIREADASNLHWFFTNGNAAAVLTEQYHDLARLNDLNWEVLRSSYWEGHRDEKQAEFLVENRVVLEKSFLGAGVMTEAMRTKVDTMFRVNAIDKHAYVKREWYFSEDCHA